MLTRRSGFQLVLVIFQLRAASANHAAAIPPEPDLSADRARGAFAGFTPAVSAGPLVFIVFGTTRTFREYMWVLFVPRVLREKVEARAKRKRAISASAGGQVPSQRRQVDLDEDAAGTGVALPMQGMGRREGDGDVSDGKKDDEWPILKSVSPVPPSWKR